MFKYLWLCILVMGWGILSEAGWAATISVTPNHFQEDYQGWLNMTVSGLPAGDLALIKLAGDQNQNGALDSNDVVYLPGIEVAAFGPDGPRSVWQMQTTGMTGHAVFPVLAGTYWIWPLCEELIAGKYQCVSGQNITVVTGEARAVAITLSLLPGDTNGDGRVDIADIFHFAQHWNEPADEANLPCNPCEDSQIDGKDLLLLMKQW